MKFQSKFIHLYSRKSVWNCRLENGGHFVSPYTIVAVPLCTLFETQYNDNVSGTTWQNWNKKYGPMIFTNNHTVWDMKNGKGYADDFNNCMHLIKRWNVVLIDGCKDI